MTEIDITTMTENDYDQVLALWQSCEGVGLTPADSRAGVEGFLARNPGLSLVAREGDELAGAVLCGHDGRRGFLYHLAVWPEYRGRGIGRALVERCLAVLAEQGIEKCNIVVCRNNASGREFWEHLDWAVREDLAYMQHLTPQEVIR